MRVLVTSHSDSRTASTMRGDGVVATKPYVAPLGRQTKVAKPCRMHGLQDRTRQTGQPAVHNGRTAREASRLAASPRAWSRCPAWRWPVLESADGGRRIRLCWRSPHKPYCRANREDRIARVMKSTRTKRQSIVSGKIGLPCAAGARGCGEAAPCRLRGYNGHFALMETRPT